MNKDELEIKIIEKEMPSGICHICKMFVVINGHCVYTAGLLNIYRQENIMTGYICSNCAKETELKQSVIVLHRPLVPFFDTTYERQTSGD